MFTNKDYPYNIEIKVESFTTGITLCLFLFNPSLSSVSNTFNSLFRVLFIFRSRYLYAIGLMNIFSVRRNLPPILGSTLKLPDSPI